MIERKPAVDIKKVDTKEFEIPETLFIRDIDNKVFQGIVLQVLSRIEGIALVEGNFIDSLLGRTGESVKGIFAEQDMKNHTIKIRVEVNVCYGVCIPEKAEEIQSAIAEEVTKLTGLHVASVHVVFKNVVHEDLSKRFMAMLPPDVARANKKGSQEEYSDEF